MISNAVGLIENPALGRNDAIMVFMLTAAMAIVTITKIDASKIASAHTFKSGMSACVCVLGVAWLGDTFVSGHITEIKDFAGTILEQYPWMLAVTLFFASMLLYSQGATTTALMPCRPGYRRSSADRCRFFRCSECAVRPADLPNPVWLRLRWMKPARPVSVTWSSTTHSSFRVWSPSRHRLPWASWLAVSSCNSHHRCD